jgi:hypothetical protein
MEGLRNTTRNLNQNSRVPQKITIFRDVTACILIENYRRFGGNHCLQLQSLRESKPRRYTAKEHTELLPGAWLSLWLWWCRQSLRNVGRLLSNKWCQIQEESIIHSQWCENLKSNKFYKYSEKRTKFYLACNSAFRFTFCALRFASHEGEIRWKQTLWPVNTPWRANILFRKDLVYLSR